MNLFDFPHYKIDKKIRLIETFGGIGSQAMALRDIGADFEHYRLVEFDKYAVASYNAIHGTDFAVTDIRDVHGENLGIVEKDRYCYLLTYSFPCTDLSVAGKMEGMSKADWEEGNSTRSGLLWEVERILKELPKEQLPDVLLMENVPQVHAEQNKADFDSWCEFLRKKGYQNFCADLNAKDYGIPQNRERCFMVSVLADDFVDFEFPAPIKLERVMKDYLEESVDEKYYINSPKARELIDRLIADGTLEGKKKLLATTDCAERLTCVSSSRGKSRLRTQYSQGTTRESKTYSRQSAALLSRQGSKFERFTDIATCLMARDYKGFGNQATNGVIETIDLNPKTAREVDVCPTIKARYDNGYCENRNDSKGAVIEWKRK